MEHNESDPEASREDLRAAQLASARANIRQVTIRCQVCGSRRNVTGKGRYCSDLCRSRAYRARKQAAKNRTPRAILADLAAALKRSDLAAARRFAADLSTNLPE